MSSVNFRKELETKILSLVQSAVGPGTNATNYVKTFDRYLHDIDIQSYPYVVVTVRQVEETGPGEMGTARELNVWNVVIYYVDITQPGEVFEDGETRRDNISHDIQHSLEINPRLDNLRVPLNITDPNFPAPGLSEYVYDSSFTTTLFDGSGQEDFFTFVTEMNLEVHTAKN